MWLGLLTIAKSLFGGVFEFLNKRVDANARVKISADTRDAAVVGGVEGGIQNADNLNAQIRMKEGKWSPWVLMTILGFMSPFAWHTWQVVLDSSRFHPAIGFWYFIPYPTVVEHIVGSWRVAALPGMFETTEHAVVQSLFIGAGAAVGAIPIIRALRGR